jgi:dihydrofolate synthase/folylpolyglutamate synthase
VGNPQDIPQSIHIAGTSGKTSTAYYSAALLKQGGKRVGLLVSPHAEFLNERVQIGLEPLEERTFCDELAVFMDTVKESGITLTYAETMYAFAYWEFARQRVEYIVVEVGMGGLLDATNVINRRDKICVITDIGMDHTNVLGDTIEEITQHKAGIIRLHNTVFCHVQSDNVIEQIRAACKQKQADLHTIAKAKYPEDLKFLPLFQRRNFTLASAAVTFAMEREGKQQLARKEVLSAARTKVPSRMEMVKMGEKTLVMDGAHNAQKLHALCESIKDYFPGQKNSLLVAFTGGRGRNLEELAAELASLTPQHVIVTSLKDKYGLATNVAPEEVAKALADAGLDTELITDQAEACKAFLAQPGPLLLATGSLYLLGEIKPLLNASFPSVD